MKVKRKISWFLVTMLLLSMFTGIQIITPQTAQASSTAIPVANANLPAGWSAVTYNIQGATSTALPDNASATAKFDSTSGLFTLGVTNGKTQTGDDSLLFAYTPVTGDFVLTAKVASVGNQPNGSSSTNNRAFISVNNGNDYNTPAFHMVIQPGAASNLYARTRTLSGTTTTGSTSAASAVTFVNDSAPAYLKMVRSGTSFTSYYSADGINWGTAIKTYSDTSSPLASASGTTLNVGISAASATVVFSNLKITQDNGNTVVFDSTPAAPSAPTMNTPAAGTGKADLSWNTVAGATYYIVKGGTTSGSYNMFANTTVASYTYSGLTIGTPYYFVVSAINAGGESANSTEVTVTPTSVLAFPGAEGGGRFTTGGRGYDVYEVTTLEDYDPLKDTPITGSLREAVSQGDRTIVFRISGIIDLKARLTISVNNLTIAGQTAPGDGICIAGFDTRINDGSKNIIIRYIRFRPGDENIDAEPDGIWGRKLTDVILDHISSGWSTDESLSFYENTNFTLQWSLISESLTMSGHFKGKHGYGGIWGGINATFHHNILAHHTSRNSRIEVGGNTIPATVDLRNNIIYDWEFNSTYGGDASSVNIVNNYYKPGPMTIDTVKNRIANPSFPSYWYLSGNYMYGDAATTADNSLGYQPDATAGATKLTSPVSIEGASSITTQSAEDAFNAVLAKAGATYPKRDSVDARVAADVKNGTGRAINRPYEVGGYPAYNSVAAPIDTDHDGMPDSWEGSHGLNINDASDGKAIITSGVNTGYSNLEVYLNSLVDMNYEAANPTVSLSSPTINSLYATGGTVQITADAAASSSATISKVEFYRNDTVNGINSVIKIGEATTAPYSCTWTNLPEGTYFISARAIDSNGLSTQSNPKTIYVNGPSVGAPWTSADIGSVGISGSASLDNGSGVMTVKGAGTLLGSTDSFQYTYQQLNGDGEMSARIDSIANIEQDAGFSGIMVRSDLSVDSPYALLGALHVKASNLSTPTAIEFLQRAAKGDNVSVLSTPTSSVTDYTYDNGVYNITTPYWIKLSRLGNAITAYSSADGTAWTYIGTKTFTNLPSSVYIGFAADAGKAANSVDNYNDADFSNISLKNTASPVPDIVFTTAVPETTDTANCTISAHPTIGANVAIKLNGVVLLSSTYKAANEEFTQDITFKEGANSIEISLTDADNNTRVFAYNTVYTPKSSGGTVINNRKIDVWDFGGVQTTDPLTNNIISRDTLAGLSTVVGGLFTGNTAIGDLTFVTNSTLKDRLYYYESDTSSNKGTASNGTWGNSIFTYADGYASRGCFYCNGTGGDSRRCLTIDNVVAGDKITVYGATTNGNETIHFTYPSTYTVAAGKKAQQDSTAAFTTTAQKVDFVAQYSGTYKIWVSASSSGKPYFNRVVRTPGVITNGKINFGSADKTGISLTFKNQTTGDLTDVSINADNTFNTVLAAGYTYTAVLKGTISYAVSDATKVVSTTSSEIPYGINDVNLDVVVNNVVTLTGIVNGFDSGYDTSKFKITFTPPIGSLAEAVTATVDTTAMTFTAVVKADQAYTAVLSGVNDYDVVSGKSVKISTDTTQNITVAKRPVYTASGAFVGLPSTAAIQSISFTNIADSYTYTGTVVSGGYTTNLRDGDYSVNAICNEGYTTIGHVSVNGSNTAKDIKFSPITGWNLVNVTNTDITAGYYKMLTLVKGTGSFAVNGNSLSAKPGSSIVIPVTAGQLVTVSGWYSGEIYFDEDPSNILTIPSTSSASAPAMLTLKATTTGTVTLKVSGTVPAYLTAINCVQQLDWVPDLYVGDSSKQNNYNTVKDALDDAAKMKPTSEAQRITIHIAPGIYRAQLRITTPYITLVNSDPSKEVKITWYYGIGYKYYSVGTDGFYNEDSAFDQYTQNNAGNGKWGATVFLTSEAKEFKAENIVFENSFNKYLTDEELKDGVTRDSKADSSITVERTATLDVTSKPATERAAAMGIEADNVEFYNCSFISSQDTLYTGSAGTFNQYYKNCFIEGNTDYIFGDGNVVFDDCTLNFFGYSNSAVGGYITAAKDLATNGYLFKDCTVTVNPNNFQTAGYFGRPWGAGAKVTFMNTKLQSDSIINPDGWTEMSGAKPEKANFYEYNTTYNGVKVDTSSRKGHVMSDSDANAINVSNYFGDWSPTYFDASAPTWAASATIIASYITRTGLTLTWSAANDKFGVTGYKVYNGSSLIATVASSEYSTNVTDLKAGTTYTFTVQAGDEADNWSSDGPSTTVKTHSSNSGTSIPSIPSTPTTPTTTDTSTVSGSTINSTAKLDSTTATAKAEISATAISTALTNAKADNNGVKTIEIIVAKVEGAKVYDQILPTDVLSQSSMGTKIVVDTPSGDIVVPGNFLSSSTLAADSKAEISLGAADTSKISDNALAKIIDDRPAISFDVKVDGQSVAKPLNGDVKLTIQYTATGDEAEKLSIVKINSDGTATKIGSSKYDKDSAGVTFKTNEPGTYAVVYDPKTFNDLSSFEWAKKQIEVLASKGIINGTSQNTFSPTENIKRADFILMLVKTLNLKSADSNENFADVKSGDYYYNALAVAKKLGIAQGTGDNLFKPEEQISRQDMMVICERALKLSEIISSQASSKDIEKYKDNSLVSNYAVEGVSAMVKEGIVTGDGTDLNPLGNASRAEIAVIMYRILMKI